MRAAKWMHVIALAISASACNVLEPRRDDTRYYTLASSDELGRKPSEPASAAASVGVGPIAMPPYVLRPEVVYRTSATELNPAEHHVWAEPIDQALARVLALDLSSKLGVSSVVSYPWQLERAPHWQVAVDIARFEVDEHDAALLVARWRAIEWPSRAVRVEREVRLTSPSGAKDVAAHVRALSETVDQLAAEIASGVAQLH